MKIEGSMGVASIKPIEANSQSVNNQDINNNSSQEVASNEAKSNKEFSENILNKAMEQANKQLKLVNRSVERHIHEKTKAIMYRIIDTQTKEVIKEFPPEKIQDMIAKMWELAGLFVDERA